MTAAAAEELVAEKDDEIKKLNTRWQGILRRTITAFMLLCSAFVPRVLTLTL